VWADKDPVAAARLQRARADLAALAEKLVLPVENLLTPDTLRRVLWEPPELDGLGDRLQEMGARPWQVELVSPVLIRAIEDAAGPSAQS